MGVLNILVEDRKQWNRLRLRLDALGFFSPQGTLLEHFDPFELPGHGGHRIKDEAVKPQVLSMDAQCIRGKGRTFVLTRSDMWNHRKNPVLTTYEFLPILTRTCPPWRQLWWRLRGK